MNKLLEKAIAEVTALPESEQEAVALRMLDEIKQRTPHTGKWAQVAERLATLNVLEGKSAQFIEHTREFRDSFALRSRPNA